ncbi:putative serine esterase-domain-containing protein [Dichotomopilus funicola]|uniref:Serine esterase-domain-containing protein n=1 Tax=Dichotomopilus funicola TaxID=1934379 RepID=A0AAN6ZPB3_9PEZI|nr:putative serine esterase-domain-containing protein [Dichotomopilus funicola]
MLLLHQTGSVKIGEVVRYTVTYTPSADHILPSPEFLYLRIKNTCAIALRAAFVHGPYTLAVSAYPSTFKPFEKFENPRRYGVPEFEPMLKAGAVWNCHLVIPDNIRQSAGEGSSKHGHFGGGPGHEGETVTWVIEVSSQVVFSASASVNYEVLLARDEKSLNLGSVVPVIGNQAQASQPGRVSDFQQSSSSQKHHPAQLKGVFSKAVRLTVEDTVALWNTPRISGWDDIGWLRARQSEDPGSVTASDAVGGQPKKAEQKPKRKQKKVHLVVLTHGLHSNLGGDMLFMKESIDAAVKQAKIDARVRKAREWAARKAAKETTDADGEAEEGQEDIVPDDEDEDGEEVVVRGFPGNAAKTERGIKYLGKRLARYILSMTYPDQPCLPTAKAASEAIAHTLKAGAPKKGIEEAHKHSSVHQTVSTGGNRLYKFTKISFIAHSLGGLVQTYAVAYIQKHSPQFFDLIEPINFIALATPFLGLNHENPLYVKFALDFGLVGRTGQDLGLTWRAPTIARNGWGALMSNLGEHAHKRVYGEHQPESKPLLRILPTGPAHKALKKFRNRTVYSNVVNDGIVPLRTSCLLFLDWQGLGRVEKARREAGLVETMVGFGWAELTGANVTTPRLAPWSPADTRGNGADGPIAGGATPTSEEDSHQVPQPPTNAMLEDDRQSLRSIASPYQEGPSELQQLQSSTTATSNPFSGIFSFFRNETPKPPAPTSSKVTKIYQRSQTLKSEQWSPAGSATSSKSKVTSGNELTEELEGMSAPPKTTIFESAGDLLNPKLPPIEFIIDPSARPRTIFHDRVYHTADIPPPPIKERSSSPLNLRRRAQTVTSQTSAPSTSSPPPSQPASHAKESVPSEESYSSEQTPGPKPSTASTTNDETSTVHTPSLDTSREPAPSDLPNDLDIDTSQMRVEEKIARAYHRGLSWRKVLVKLEPDAHNNIVVRRTFANAFGWPVVQHLVEAHFSDTATARRRDEDEPNAERAKDLSQPPSKGDGGERRNTATRQDAHGERTIIEDRAGRGVGSSGGDDSSYGSGEEADIVPELPRSPKLSPSLAASSTTNTGNALGVSAAGVSDVTWARTPTTPRPLLDRLDSVTWSERDWLDSGDESDDGVGERGDSRSGSMGGGPEGEKGAALRGREGEGKLGVPGSASGGKSSRSPSPLSWNWAEKIVGKGGAGKSKSPKIGSNSHASAEVGKTAK